MRITVSYVLLLLAATPTATTAVHVGGAAASIAAAAAAAASGGPVCPDPEARTQNARFHSDTVCNRAAYNSYKDSLKRHLKYQAFKKMGSVQHVPNQKTSYCPLNPQQFHMAADITDTGATGTGMDTVWIVENAASSAVVVSFINSQGIEVSARNPDISPAERDPAAILQPHQWMAVNTFEGHTFYARELLEDGSAGNILLQHRVGLIPVGAGFESYDCPEQDIEPIKDDVRDPEFARTKPAVMRPCNTMDIGFRNMVGCPLHGYYVQPGAAAAPDGELACEEHFKFHLGVQQDNLPDFMWDWTSETKFEGTFLGHTFNFRLAHNPSVLVESITLEPTQVMDCPELKQKVAVRVSGDGIAVPVGLGEHLPGQNQSNNTTSWFNASNNTTTTTPASTTTAATAARAAGSYILS